MSEQLSEVRVDLLVFRIGSSRYAADASQVTRIDRVTHNAHLIDALGMPDLGQRGLCFDTFDGEEQICVDQVEGVHAVPLTDLRRLPLATGPARGVLGVWLEGGERPVILLDLPETLAAARGGH